MIFHSHGMSWTALDRVIADNDVKRAQPVLMKVCEGVFLQLGRSLRFVAGLCFFARFFPPSRIQNALCVRTIVCDNHVFLHSAFLSAIIFGS